MKTHTILSPVPPTIAQTRIAQAQIAQTQTTIQPILEKPVRQLFVCIALGCWCLALASAQTALKSSQRFKQKNHQASHAAETIKIGVSVVASDPDDLPQLRSARMAVEEINASGGVLGKPLELVTTYSATRNYDEIQPALKSLRSRGVSTVLVLGGSGLLLKAAEFTVKKGMLLFGSAASSPLISWLNDKNLVWRTIPSDVHQGTLAAEQLETVKRRKGAIMHIDNAYGNELAHAFREAFERRGGTIVATVSFPDKPSYKGVDFTSRLKDLYARKPDIIYLVSYTEDGVEILNQSKKGSFIGTVDKATGKKYLPQFLGCDGNYNGDFLLGADPEVIEGMMGLAYIHPKDYPHYETFIEKFRNYTPPAPDSIELANSSLASLLDAESTYSFAATSYDAIYLIALAMQKAGSSKPREVVKHLQDVSTTGEGKELCSVNEFAKAREALSAGKSVNYDGASGLIEFNSRGDVSTGTYIVWRVVQGKFTEVQTIGFP